MMSRFNVFKIIKSHIETLRSINPSRPDWFEIFISFGLPCLIASGLLFIDVKLIDLVSDLLTTISIIGGFLFTLLALIYGIIEKIKEGNSQLNSTNNNSNPPPSANNSFFVRGQFAKEIHANISFCIILSILCCFFLVILKLTTNLDFECICYFRMILLWVNYYFLGVFFLTLIFILKRIFDFMSS